MPSQINQNDYDFYGIATKYGVKCSDGRTIKHGAFKHQDGARVPLIWRHGHDDMRNIVGHGILKSFDDHMKLYAKFNKTASGKDAKELVHAKDIEWLSIWANEIVQDSNMVVHSGMIKEVSLVIASKNPGSRIENVIVHGDGIYTEDEILDDQLIIFSGERIMLEHEEEVSDEDVSHEASETVADVLKTFNEDQLKLVDMVLNHALGGETEEGTEEGDGPTFEDVFNTLNEKQKNVLYYMAGKAESAPKEVAHTEVADNTEETGELNMKTAVSGQASHSIFEGDNQAEAGPVISHAELMGVMETAVTKKVPSLKDAFIAHAGTYGIDNINVLFPDARPVHQGGPQFIMEDQEWVGKVLSKARHTPFSRIKSMYATITADEARARGYVTGSEKFEEVFPVFSRVTTPQTIYKKQKLDRDDIVDITDFDVVRWMKAEMQLKLREELARAILIGDGRNIAHADKILPTYIRPIYGDDVIYAHLHTAFLAADDVLTIIDGVVEARPNYKGAGNPTLFVAPGLLTSMLLVRDTTNRRIYNTKADLAAAMLVNDIVEVPFMAGVNRIDTVQYNLLAIMINMQDYVIGADKGGETTFFEDFDIDFNQYKYLYESRVSGALVNPKSAIVFEQLDA